MDTLKILFSGALGGVCVYYIPKLLKKVLYRRRPILIYQFDDNGNDQPLRRIHHSFGRVVDDNDASNKRAWEHTKDRSAPGHATCYGPYTKEIPFRGKYKARFRIKTEGVRNENNPVVVLDVTHGMIRLDGKPVILGLPLVERKILGREFENGKYKDFDVYFEYDGQSLLEFRCAVINPESFSENGARIFFDNVNIFHVIEML